MNVWSYECIYGVQLRCFSLIAILNTTRDLNHVPCASPKTDPTDRKKEGQTGEQTERKEDSQEDRKEERQTGEQTERRKERTGRKNEWQT